MTEIWKTRPVDVIVESPALAALLRSHARSLEMGVKVGVRRLSYFKALLKLPYRFFKRLGRILKIKFDVWRFGLHSQQSLESKILVYGFVLEGSFKDSKYSDRYFGELISRLSSGGYGKIVLVPNFSEMKNFARLKAGMGDNPEFAIFSKEAYLGWAEYIGLIFRWASSLNFLFKRDEGKFSILVREEILLKSFSEIFFESILISYFIRKITAGPPIERFVSWHENHLNNRACAKTFFDLGKESAYLPYQGVILDPDFDFYIRPTWTEVQRGLFPKKIAIAGGKMADPHLGALGVEVLESPSFRLLNYANSSRVQVEDRPPKVLVALSLDCRISKCLVRFVEELSRRWEMVHFSVRCHPLLPLHLNESANLRYDDEANVTRSLQQSGLVITGGSGFPLEAALAGVPSLVVRPKGMATALRIPHSARGAFVRAIDEACFPSQKEIFEWINDKNLILARAEITQVLMENYVKGSRTISYDILRSSGGSS